MSRLFFSSLSGVDYGGSIDPLSLNPTVYFQVFDTSYLTPSSPSSGDSITEIRQYTAQTYTVSGTSGCVATYDTISSQDVLYFPGVNGGCWPPPCSGSCTTYYSTDQNIGFMSESGYSFTLYFVGKPLSGQTSLGHIICDNYMAAPKPNTVQYLTVKDYKNIYFVSELDGFGGNILEIPIEVNSTSLDLNSKDLRVFSVRAQDTGDLISTAAYSYVNGIQTSSVTQTNLSTFTAPNSIANLGGIDDGDSLNTYRGYFGEIIIFNELHSIDTHTKVINFLKERWNIT
jgi:hypothetical protein